jgi:predicted acyltransferase (DUF342 family)
MLDDTGISQDRFEVTLNHPGMSISPERARFTIPEGAISQEPIFPKRKDELDSPTLIGNRARAERFIHSHGSLTVGNRAALVESVYARDEVQIGRACRVNGNIISSGRIQIGIGTIVNGYLISNGEEPVDVNDFCEAQGLIARGDVRIGKRVRLPFIRSFGNVTLDSDFEGDWIEAQDVDVGPNGRVREIKARGELILRDGVRVDRLDVAYELKIGQAVEVRLMNTVVTERALLPEAAPLRLGNSLVTPLNRFTWQAERTTLEKAEQASDSPTVTVITSLLDHQLLETIQSITGLELRIPSNPGQP